MRLADGNRMAASPVSRRRLRGSPHSAFTRPVREGVRRRLYFPYCWAALAIDGPAVARSCGFMIGRKETFALKARNQGSATAGICDVSFMSNTMEPDRWP